jgi:hypothetical protein
MSGIGTAEKPFGVTLDDIIAFDSESKPVRIHNRPMRDVEKESFWDFMNKDCQEDAITTEVIKAIKGE